MRMRWGNVLVLVAMVVLLGAGRFGRTPATPDFIVVERGETVDVDVLANDGQLGDGLVLHSVSYTGARGSATMLDNRVRFSVHPEAEYGAAVVNYVVRTQAGSHHVGRLTVDVTPPVLTLLGRVASTQSGCTVEVVVGRARYPGCIVNGLFAIDVPLLNLDSVVVIEARLASTFTSNVPPQRFASVLRPLSELVELSDAAGTPGMLTFDHFGPLNVSEYTTGHYGLLVKRHGERILADAAALAAAEPFLDYARIQQFAEIFRGTRRGSIQLPAGTRDALALLNNLDAFAQLYAAQDAFALRVLQGQLTDASYPWLSLATPEVMLSGAPSAPGSIAVPFVQGAMLSFGDQPQGNVYEVTATTGSSADWSLFNERLSISPDHDVLTSVPGTIFCDGQPQPYTFEFAERLTQLSRVVEGAGADIALARSVRVLLNGQVPPNCTHSQSPSQVLHTARQIIDSRHRRPMGEPAELGRWAVRLPGPQAAGQISSLVGNAGIIDFSAPAVMAPGYHGSLSVSDNTNGGLDLQMLVDVEGAWVPLEMQLFRAREDGRGGELWIGGADSASLGAVGVGGLAAPVTHPDYFLDPDNLPGVWRSGFTISTEGTAWAQTNELLFDIQPGFPGEGTRYSFVPGGSLNAWPFGWEVDGDGRLVMTTWQSMVDFRLHARCPAGDQCYPLQRRTWQPVSLAPGEGPRRLYMIEELFTGTQGVQEPTLASRRVNFYEEGELPPMAELPAPSPVDTGRRMR